MSSLGKAIIAVIVAVIIIGGGYLAFHKSSDTTSSSDASRPTSTSSNEGPTPSASEHATPAATITYTGSGFTPATTTVKTGDTVQITNSSSRPLNFDSDPHPTHTDNLELNVGSVGPGQSATIKVTKAGSWGFHNHLDPTQRGTLNVQ